MSGTSARVGVLVAAAPDGAIPAAADEMTPEEARSFVIGKHFSYTCFEGTSGNGRILADGSVAGYIRIRGAGPRFVVMPPTRCK